MAFSRYFREKSMENEKKFRQYRSNQGRSPERMEGTYKAFGYSLVAMVIVIICYGLSKLF